MKVWIISDIHSSPLDLFFGDTLDVPDADLCVCAGDISGSIKRSVSYVMAEIAHRMPVVWVLGNHDYYSSSINRALEYARRETAGTNVSVLENEEFLKGDLRVIGATLWTDYSIRAHKFGRLPIEERRAVAMEESYRSMMDCRTIFSDEEARGEGMAVTPDEILSRHRESRAYITARLNMPFNGSTMVLTHHAPSARSLDKRFKGHVTNAAFASDLTHMIRKQRPTFWVHGHIHRFVDYTVGDTRVVCNPMGYTRERLGWTGFRPGFVIDTTAVEAK